MTSATGQQEGVLTEDWALRPKSVTDATLDLLRARILSGELRPGQRLNEVAIAERLGTSRTPVREALQALTAQGLVRAVAGKGSFVMDFDRDALRHLGDVRIGLERRAAELAAAKADDAQLDRMSSLLSQTRESMEHSDGYPVEFDFHLELVRSVGNPHLLTFATDVNMQFRLARATSGYQPSRAAAAYQEHLDVLSALRDRDPVEAGRAMERHLLNSIDSILQVLDAHQLDPGS